MIRVKNVYKSFDHLEVLKGINCYVAPREVVCVIGPASTSWNQSNPGIS